LGKGEGKRREPLLLKNQRKKIKKLGVPTIQEEENQSRKPRKVTSSWLC
jgi:hypothetical protein